MTQVGTSASKDEPSWSVDQKVLALAATLGITEGHLLFMVQYSTRITHDHGNRRFHGYLFNVEGNNVTGFCRLDGVPLTKPVPDAKPMKVGSCEKCHGEGKVLVYDPCPLCEGAGCKDCESGFLPSTIPCQMCGPRPNVFRKG